MKLFVTIQTVTATYCSARACALANIMLSVISDFVEMPTIFTGTLPKRNAKSFSSIYSPEDPWKAQESLNFPSFVNNDATFCNFYDYLCTVKSNV